MSLLSTLKGRIGKIGIAINSSEKLFGIESQQMLGNFRDTTELYVDS